MVGEALASRFQPAQIGVEVVDQVIDRNLGPRLTGLGLELRQVAHQRQVRGPLSV